MKKLFSWLLHPWLLATLGSLLYCLVVYTGFRYAPAAHGAILLSGMQPFLISAIVLAVDGIRPNRMRSLGLIGIRRRFVRRPRSQAWPGQQAQYLALRTRQRGKQGEQAGEDEQWQAKVRHGRGQNRERLCSVYDGNLPCFAPPPGSLRQAC